MQAEIKAKGKKKQEILILESLIADVKKSLEDLNSKFEMAGEKKSSKFEYRSIENMHSKE